jgi:DNA invertase Pin-like site-specific DNA recombinase
MSGCLAQQRRATILTEYREVETGKRKDRPELAKALAHCRRSKATLVVAKLDRLARNVAFTSALMESKVDFVCCDNPHATKLTIHILAAVAEHEAEMISQRTKAALEAAKARGVKLGSHRPGHWDGREDRRLAGVQAAAKAAGEVHAQAANEAYSDLYPMIRKLREEGRTLQQIADKLNRKGHTTRRGKAWNPTQVARVLRRV